MTVFLPGIFFFGGGNPIPPQKKFTIPPNGFQIGCSKFWGGDLHQLQIYHGNILLMDNKHRKVFVIKQSKGCKFMPKIHQNTFGSRALPGPVGGGLMQMHSRRPSSRNGGLFLRAGRDREWVYI